MRRIVSHVFHRGGQPIRDYRNAWHAAVKAAGVEGRIPHDFRRTAVRNLEWVGVPRSWAMKLVGTKTESIYRRYGITARAELDEAAGRLSKFLATGEKKRGKGSPTQKGTRMTKTLAVAFLALLAAGMAHAETWTGTLAGRLVTCDVVNYLTSAPSAQDSNTRLFGKCTKLVGRKRAIQIYPPGTGHDSLSQICQRWLPSKKKFGVEFYRLRTPCCHVAVETMGFVPAPRGGDVGAQFHGVVTCHHHVVGDLFMSHSAFPLPEREN